MASCLVISGAVKRQLMFSSCIIFQLSNIVTRQLKTRIGEGVEVVIARQQSGKHVSTVINQNTTTEELLEVVFSVWYMPKLYSEDQHEKSVSQS
jgi:hypothetical protein